MIIFVCFELKVSLAVADLLVLISAVPEAVVSHHIGKRWIAGHVACSVFVFANFLGINAGSMRYDILELSRSVGN